MLTARWTTLKYHPVQHAYWTSAARFNVVPAGRRSGKTELAKRKIVRRALSFHSHDNGRFVCAAPTMPQAKRIYWRDLKKLVPKWARVHVSETHCALYLPNGASLEVVGMDKPERIEGDPLDGIVLDEYANMKERTWQEHVRPALSTVGRPGWADFIGVPEGLNHYFALYERGLDPKAKHWASYTWESADILSPDEILEAMEDMDEETFNQEYRGQFIKFAGRAYYAFERATHCEELPYYDTAPVSFDFDFNISPGVCAVTQEQDYTGALPGRADVITAVIGEVWIPRYSNTERVCKALLESRFATHRGEVHLYGDATGGAGGSAKLHGSDWDIIKAYLRPVFGDRLKDKVRKGNPAPATRRVAMNTRIRNAAGRMALLVDVRHAPHVARDLERVAMIEGVNEMNENDGEIGHISAALGYEIAARYPAGAGKKLVVHRI